MNSEVVTIKGEFSHVGNITLVKEYNGDRLLFADPDRFNIICETSDLNLDGYIGIHFCGDDCRRHISLRLAMVEKPELLFNQSAILKEEQYVFNGELQEKDNNIMIGDDTLYDILWKKSPLKTCDKGFIYMEIYLDFIN